MTSYPAVSAARDRYVLALRGSRPGHDPWRYQDAIVEDERAADGRIVRVGVVLLTGRECPWRCVMCDLWRGTTSSDTPRGAIPAQIAAARRAFAGEAADVTHMKLYNAGSFFDPRAVPDDDYGAIAAELVGLEQITVESHPSLIGPRLDRLIEALGISTSPGQRPARLEVAMGLETAHPVALEQLNKRMTLDTFAQAVERLQARDVALRVFLLLWPPFVPPHEQDEWHRRSLDHAFASGASVVSFVPTRGGDPAMEALAAAGAFRQPTLDDIEHVADLAFASRPSGRRVFVDLWDLPRFASCKACLPARHERLRQMNLQQVSLPRGRCDLCGGGTVGT